MRTVPEATLALLQAAPESGVETRDFVTVYCRNLEGEPATFGFWAGLDTVEQDVIDPDTGSTDARTFEGDGTLLEVGRIVATSDLSIRKTLVALSPLVPLVADMVNGHVLRGATVQIHRAELDPATMLPADPPQCVFAGFVDGAPDPRPKPGSGEARVTLNLASDTRRLTRSNPAKFSDAQVRSRDPDDSFGAYAGAVTNWEINVGVDD